MYFKTARNCALVMVACLTLASIASLPKSATADDSPKVPFEPTWESIKKNYEVPQWFSDAKFGIFIHWGLYSIPAYAQDTNSNARPRRPLPEPADPKLPSLFLIGDSTVRNGQGDGAGRQWGWGEPLAAFFDPTKINLVNRAVGGLSSRTCLTGGHWDRVLGLLKPHDFVIMQFGHNDGGEINDTSRARGSLGGTGEETQEIDNLLTKQHEVVHTYGWYLRRFIADTRARGATPIVCSLIPRKIWKDRRIVRNSGDYAGWAAEVAKSEHVAFVDLNEIIARKYDELGPEKVEVLFADPHTHTSLAGAELNAACVIAGLKTLRVDPLAAYFSAKAKEVSKAEVSHPK